MIGCGQICNRFFDQAAPRDDVEFVATCARTLASAEAKAKERGVPQWFSSYEVLMDEVHPDGVVVTTPHSVHADPSIAALRRGIHVLVEKPMATTLEDGRRMVEAADASGAILMVLPFDHTPDFLTALSFLKEEWLGKLTGAEAELVLPGPPRDNWYYDRSVAHGGAMLDCLVYPMSRLISLLGPASTVTARVNTLIPHRIVGDGKRVQSTVDDNVTLIVEWAGGQQAVVRTLWGTSFFRNETAVYGRKGTLWLAGGKVTLHSPSRPVPGAEPATFNGISDCYQVPISPEAPSESILGHFVDSITSGRQPKCGGHLQLHVHEILMKAYVASETGQTQQLETTFTPWHDLSPALFDTRSDFI
jgi:predicted dehydrogenase